MIIQFRDVIYSVVEGVRVYNVTVEKEGEPGLDLLISIFPSPDSTAADTVECKSYNHSVIKGSCSYIYCYKL